MLLLSQYRQTREDLIVDLVSNKITSETMHNKNFQLGKLELLNEILDEGFFNDLVESLEEAGQ